MHVHTYNAYTQNNETDKYTTRQWKYVGAKKDYDCHFMTRSVVLHEGKVKSLRNWCACMNIDVNSGNKRGIEGS